MDYKICKQLKDAGFPQIPQHSFHLERDKNGKERTDSSVTIPTLEGLIKECEKRFTGLYYQPWEKEYPWISDGRNEKISAITGADKDCKTAVAKLYLKLNN